jgi:dipeptide/tripeptide permease
VVLLVRRGPLSAAENDLKGAIRAGRRISDFAGAARQSARALPFLIPGWALFMLGYNLSYGSVHGFTSLFCGERIDWLWSIGPVSTVLLAPLAVLLVCLVVRSRERIRHTSLAAAGMLAAAAAVAVLLVGSLLAAGPVSDAAPSWHSETPSLAWPIGAVLLLGVADLVAVPLFHAFVLAASPRRVRGLMLGLTIAAVGHFAFLDRFFYDWLEVIAFTWRTASVCAALLLTALLVFAVGKAHRRP